MHGTATAHSSHPAHPGHPAHLAKPTGPKPGRDPRLDIFRGLAMLVIFIAHVPDNPWAKWIWARFGPSDATELFVFCSGFAASVAFGGTFKRQGWWMGTARVVHRCWQIYWANICVFLATVAVMVLLLHLAGPTPTWERFGLGPVLANAGDAILGLLTLSYLHAYFDILPMYFAVLLLMPVMVLLLRRSVWLAVAVSVALYGLAWWGVNLPAEPWSERHWYFNPFAWQLIFFTGFAIGGGWIKPPPVDRRLVLACLVFVVILVPLSHDDIAWTTPWLQEIRPALWWGFHKQELGLLRYLHFLALAYLVVAALHGRLELLRHRAFVPLFRIGQQALPTFLVGTVLSWTAGVFLDVAGRGWLPVAAANMAGCLLILATAHVAGFFKGQPWQAHKKAVATPSAVGRIGEA